MSTKEKLFQMQFKAARRALEQVLKNPKKQFEIAVFASFYNIQKLK